MKKKQLDDRRHINQGPTVECDVKLCINYLLSIVFGNNNCSLINGRWNKINDVRISLVVISYDELQSSVLKQIRNDYVFRLDISKSKTKHFIKNKIFLYVSL